jgi:hypothetical protein
MPYLIESCKRNGKELTVLGLNEKWLGFNWRFKLVINFLKNINEDDIVCFIDGYDVICTRDLSELKNEFLKIKNEFNCKIVIGYDRMDKNYIFNLITNCCLNFIFRNCKGLNLNAGTYIGYAKDLLNILETIIKYDSSNKADDQILMTTICNSNKDYFYIDKNNKLFLTIANIFDDIDKKVITNNKIIYNNNVPFFIHAPGSTYLDNVIKFLGYKIDDRIKNKLKSKSKLSLLYFIRENFKVQLVICICLLLIIYIIKNILLYYK